MERILRSVCVMAALALFPFACYGASNVGNLGAIKNTGGWVYVEGSLAFSSARNAGFVDDSNGAGSDCFLISTGVGACGGSLDHLGDGTAAGFGIGWRFSELFRVDVGYARRTGYDLSGRDPGGTEFDPRVTSDAFMLNAYVDLPFSFGRVRPFAGGGIGASRNKMGPLTWRDGTSTGTLPGGTHTGFAWQGTFGFDIMLTDNWTLSPGYRYADLGKFKKDRGPDLAGGPFNPSGVTGSATGKLRTNELFIGARYTFR